MEKGGNEINLCVVGYMHMHIYINLYKHCVCIFIYVLCTGPKYEIYSVFVSFISDLLLIKVNLEGKSLWHVRFPLRKWGLRNLLRVKKQK